MTLIGERTSCSCTARVGAPLKCHSISEVGDALARYVRSGRPRCATRRIFMRGYAPRVGFANSSAICCIVERALARAGVNSVRKGSHLFRHTEMLRHGASLG